MGTHKTAFVFSGGGSRGSIQVGMVKRLYEKDIRPDIVTGVSIGAANAFFTAQDKVDQMESLWRSIKSNQEVFRKRLFAAPLMFFGWQWGYPSLYKPGPLAKKLAKYASRCKPQDFQAELRIGAVDLITGDYISVCQNHPCLSTFLSGSMAIPLAFPPVRIKRRKCPDLAGLYVDGCIRNLTPLSEAIRLGAGTVHVFLTNSSDIEEHNVSYRSHEMIIDRMVDINLHELLLRDIDNVLVRNELAAWQAKEHGPQLTRFRQVDIYIYDPQDAELQGVLDFDPEAIADAIEIGYKLADHPKKPQDLACKYSDYYTIPEGHRYVDFELQKNAGQVAVGK